MLDKRILEGLDRLIKNDGYILSIDVNERSITHKLAEYYQLLFVDWHVDCEYNRNLSGPKTINIEPREVIERMARFLEKGDNHLLDSLRKRDKFTKQDFIYLSEQLRNPENLLRNEELDLIYFILTLTDGKKLVKAINPDIIVHHRGTGDNNIVVEVKKSSNKRRESRLYDLIKLMSLVDSPDYQYKQGVFIDISTGQDFLKYHGFRSTEYCDNVYKIVSY